MRPMSTPWLSVIVPTYNGAAYLEAALDSIAAQRDPRVEVVVVDDGSTDATLAIAESFGDRLCLRIEARAHCGNWIAGTNRGMALARGEYLCWLHQDDVWHPSRLQVLRDLTLRHPEADLFIHPVRFIDELGRTVGTQLCPLERRDATYSDVEIIERLLVQNFLTCPAPLFRAAAAAKAGPVDERLWYCGDWDFWLRLAAGGETFYHSEPLAAFRLHPGSQSLSRSGEVALQMSRLIERHLESWRGRLPHFSRVAPVARFSADVNAALLRLAAGRPAGLLHLVWRFARLGPPGWVRYLHDSRIVERVSGRVRAGLWRHRENWRERRRDMAPCREARAGYRSETSSPPTGARLIDI